jgi:hypothetical protein
MIMIMKTSCKYKVYYISCIVLYVVSKQTKNNGTNHYRIYLFIIIYLLCRTTVYNIICIYIYIYIYKLTITTIIKLYIIHNIIKYFIYIYYYYILYWYSTLLSSTTIQYYYLVLLSSSSCSSS